MISVTLGTNTTRSTVLVNPDQTLRKVLDENQINYAVADVRLDGMSLRPSDMDKTFAAMGITDKCYLLAVVKADNA
jgi:hypothetical protein